MLFARLLRYIGGSVDEELLRRNAFLEAQLKELLRQSQKPFRFPISFKMEAARLAKALSPKSLEEVSFLVRPSTLLRWHRKLIAAKFDGSKARAYPGRPRINRETERLILEMASDHPDWGPKRIQGALAHIDIHISHQTVHNVLKRNGFHPSPRPKGDPSWAVFIQRHLDLMVATDFFTVEVDRFGKLVTHYVLFFIDLKTRIVQIGGITTNPDERWMLQIARNMTMEGSSFFENKRFLIHDRDTKYCKSFRKIFRYQGVRCLRLPAFSPNLNPHAERWVRSIKSECLQYLIPQSKPFLERAVLEYLAHYNQERTHQGVGNVVLTPREGIFNPDSSIKVSHRIGGLLSYYHR